MVPLLLWVGFLCVMVSVFIFTSNMLLLLIYLFPTQTTI